jgi:hypothetical protein
MAPTRQEVLVVAGGRTTARWVNTCPQETCFRITLKKGKFSSKFFLLDENFGSKAMG